MQTIIAKMKKLSTKRKRSVETVRTKRDKSRSKTPEDKLKKLEEEWTMTQKDILRKPTKVQLQHLEDFRRKIQEYRKKNNITEEYEIPLLEFGENDVNKLRKRISDELFENTKPKGKLPYLHGKYTSDYDKWKKSLNDIIQLRAPDIRSRGIAEEEMVTILPLIISTKSPFRETILEIINKLEKNESQHVTLTKLLEEVDTELSVNGTKWFDQNRIKQPFQGKTESILSYIERFERYMDIHYGFSTNIEKDTAKEELLIKEFIKGVAPRVKKEQATLIHMNVSYGELKKSLLKYSTYENEERREQNRQINNIQDTRNKLKQPWKRNSNQFDRHNFNSRRIKNNFRKNNNKNGYTNYKSNSKPRFRRSHDNTTINQLSLTKNNNTKPEISLLIGFNYYTTLIDTGSQINLIRRRAWNDIHPEHKCPIDKCNLEVTTIDGSVINIEGSTYIWQDSHKDGTPIKFHIIEYMEYDLLLGMDGIIDFNDGNAVRISRTSITLRNEEYPYNSTQSSRPKCNFIQLFTTLFLIATLFIQPISANKLMECNIPKDISKIFYGLGTLPMTNLAVVKSNYYNNCIKTGNNTFFLHNNLIIDYHKINEFHSLEPSKYCGREHYQLTENPNITFSMIELTDTYHKSIATEIMKKYNDNFFKITSNCTLTTHGKKKSDEHEDSPSAFEKSFKTNRTPIRSKSQIPQLANRIEEVTTQQRNKCEEELKKCNNKLDAIKENMINKQIISDLEATINGVDEEIRKQTREINSLTKAISQTMHNIQNLPKHDDTTTTSNLQAIMTDLERNIQSYKEERRKNAGDSTTTETHSMIQTKLDDIEKTIKSISISTSDSDLESIKELLKEIKQLSESDAHIKKSEWDKILTFINEISSFETPTDGVSASVASIISLITAGIARSGINKIMEARKTEKPETIKNEYKKVTDAKRPILRRKEGLFSTRIALLQNAQQQNTAIKIEMNEKTTLALIDTGANASVITKDLYQELPIEQKENIQSSDDEMLTITNEKLNVLGKTRIKILNYWIECYVPKKTCHTN